MDKLQQFFTLEKFQFNKNKKLFLTWVIIIIVLIIIGALIYIFFFEESMGQEQGTFYFGKVNSNYSMSLTNEDIIRPISFDSFTFSFWINISDFYTNNSFWRHVFHKGTPISKQSILNYSFWENLSKEIPIQAPGVWMHPDKNSLRFCFTTIDYFSRDIKEEALPVTVPPVYEVKERDQAIESIEYCDLHNIPIDELTHIVMTLEDHIVTLYINGKIVKTCNLKGKPQFNNGDTYFSYSKSYNGYLDHFTYIPKIIKPYRIKALYEDKPKKE